MVKIRSTRSLLFCELVAIWAISVHWTCRLNQGCYDLAIALSETLYEISMYFAGVRFSVGMW